MKKQKEPVQCPKCGEWKMITLRERYALFVLVFGMFFVIGGILSIILIGIPFFIAGLIGMIYCLIVMWRPKTKHTHYCKNCGYKFDDREMKKEAVTATAK